MSAENTIDEKRERRRRRRAAVSGTDVAAEEGDLGAEARGITEGKGRATPGRRNQAAEADEGNIVTRRTSTLVEYMQGVRSELEKVAWPTREDTIRLTIIVLAVTIVAALLLGLISFIFTELFRVGLATPVIMIAVFLVIAAVAAYFLVLRPRQSSSGY